MAFSWRCWPRSGTAAAEGGHWACPEVCDTRPRSPGPASRAWQPGNGNRPPGGTVQGVANIVEPDDLSVGRVEEWDMQALKVEDVACDASGVSRSLGEGVLGSQREPLGLYDAKDVVVMAEGVICRPAGRLILVNPIGSEQRPLIRSPAQAVEYRVYPYNASTILPLRHYSSTPAKGITQLRRRLAGTRACTQSAMTFGDALVMPWPLDNRRSDSRHVDPSRAYRVRAGISMQR